MMGKYWVPSREHMIKATSNAMFTRAMEQGYDVVVDNMNLSESSTRDFILIANRYNAEIEYVDFKTPLEVCIERDSKRECPIGEEVIRNTYNKYKEFYN